MKINSINNTNLTFGYNKKLNEKLENTLKKDDAPIASRILDLNKYCNSVEDQIDILNKNNQSTSKTNQLWDLLIPVKTALAEKIEELYPKLNYAKKEGEHYYNQGYKEVQKGILPEKSGKFALGSQILNLIGENTNEDDNASSSLELLTPYVPKNNSPKNLDEVTVNSNVKKKLYDCLITTTQNPASAQKDLEEYGLIYPKGILLHGPSGCGKSRIIEAIANETQIPMFNLNLAVAVTNPAFFNQAFQYIDSFIVKNDTPVLLQMENIDTIQEAEGISNINIAQISDLMNDNPNIIVLATAEDNKNLNPKIKSRFEEQINVPLPNKEERMAIIADNLFDKSKASEFLKSLTNLEEVANLFDKNSIKDLNIASEKAARIAKNNGKREIGIEDFKLAKKEMDNEEGTQKNPNRGKIGYVLN